MPGSNEKCFPPQFLAKEHIIRGRCIQRRGSIQESDLYLLIKEGSLLIIPTCLFPNMHFPEGNKIVTAREKKSFLSLSDVEASRNTILLLKKQSGCGRVQKNHLISSPNGVDFLLSDVLCACCCFFNKNFNKRMHLI